MNLKEIAKIIKKNSLEMNWDKGHSPEKLARSIIIEAAELLENYQWSDIPTNKENIKEEIADILIYSLIFCYKNDIDPENAIYSKLKKNKEKNKNNSKHG